MFKPYFPQLVEPFAMFHLRYIKKQRATSEVKDHSKRYDKTLIITGSNAIGHIIYIAGNGNLDNWNSFAHISLELMIAVAEIEPRFYADRILQQWRFK